MNDYNNKKKNPTQWNINNFSHNESYRKLNGFLDHVWGKNPILFFLVVLFIIILLI